MCASRLRRGRARQARQKSLASVGVSPPNLFRSFPFVQFVIAGLDPAIHAEAEPAQRNPPALVGVTSAWTTGIGVRRTPFCERQSPVVTISESGVTVAFHSSGAETHRENENLFPSHPRAQRVVGRGQGWGHFHLRPPPRLISLT